MEEYNGNIVWSIDFHILHNLPDSGLLAIPFYLLCVADRIGHSQTYQAYEEIRIQP